MSKEALIHVDIQRDFCPGGALAVNGGDKVVVPANELTRAFREAGQLVIVTRDWHHSGNSAHMGEGKWPIHCLQHTPGAEFHPALDTEGVVIISKGMGNSDDGYSGFEGRTTMGRSLGEVLDYHGIESVVVDGLATDYCVQATVLDARKKYSVTVVENAIAAVSPETGQAAITKMKEAGAVFMPSDLIIRSIK